MFVLKKIRNFKKLAGDISRKTGERYSQVVSGIRTRFAFCMAHSAVVCLRGSRSLSKFNILKRRTMVEESVAAPSTVLLQECGLLK